MDPAPPVEVRALRDADRPWLRERLIEAFASPRVAARGRLHRADALPGLLALRGGVPAGALTFEVRDRALEVVTLTAEPGSGAAARLLEEARRLAAERGCTRLWLVTTNDNARARRFCEKCGLRHVRTHPGAVARARRLKPEIPETNAEGVAIRDELEFEVAT